MHWCLNSLVSLGHFIAFFKMEVYNILLHGQHLALLLDVERLYLIFEKQLHQVFIIREYRDDSRIRESDEGKLWHIYTIF
jgi:hypothetical protein